MNIIPDISQSMVDQMAKNAPKEMKDFLPQASAQGELALALEFLGGTHRANIYVDGVKKSRVQVLDLLSERNFIRNGQDFWFYDAGKQTVRHSVVTEADEARAEKEASNFLNANSSKIAFDATSPASVAEYFLNQASSSTTFTVGNDAMVAGRGAYQITMTPRTADTLVKSVRLSIDGATGLPLAVSVSAAGQSSAAFEIGFETISFERPSAEFFNFTVPTGAKLIEVPLPTEADLKKYTGKTPTAADEARARAEFEKLQKAGWSAVVEIPANEVPAEFSLGIKGNKLYKELTKPVAGGRLFTTALMNVLIADDGRILAGAVTPEKLIEAAAK
jgi:outer membrane lipoprotein-sorting protein